MPIYRKQDLSLPKKRKVSGQKNSNLVLLPTTEVMLNCFARYLELNVAEGDAAPDTITTYNRRINQYLAWCIANHVTPARAEQEDILLFRSYLIKQKKQQPNTISLTLVAIRQFYKACLNKNLVTSNPVVGVKAPKNKVRKGDCVTYLTLSQLSRLFDAVGNDDRLSVLRDRTIIAMMALEGLRSVELWRANLGDIRASREGYFLKVEGKKKIRTVPIREDIVWLLERYKSLRKTAGFDLDSSRPLMISLSNFTKGQRLSRRGIEYIVDGYLVKTGYKQIDAVSNRSTHSLRHTAGTLSLAGGATLRQTQELLGHSDPKTTAIYTHLLDRHENNPAKKIDIEVSRSPS